MEHSHLVGNYRSAGQYRHLKPHRCGPGCYMYDLFNPRMIFGIINHGGYWQLVEVRREDAFAVGIFYEYLDAAERGTSPYGSPDKIYRENFTSLARFTTKEAALRYLKQFLNECLNPEVNADNSELHRCWGRVT
jgi:hypothetical protein